MVSNVIQLPESFEKPVAWHAETDQIVLQRLQSSAVGLSEAEVAERQRDFGLNQLPTPAPPTLFVIVLHQLKSPLIYILLVAGVVSILIGDSKDAIFIFAVVALNAALGAYQEWRAERSAAALQHLLQVQAHVRRNGSERRIPAEELVPGDIVLLESGNRVPADIRLLRTQNLSIDESFLTGESLAVEKQIAPLQEDAPLSERKNLTFAGSTVVSGRGLGVVITTGMRTEVGTIAEAVTGADTTRPPLVIRMERFARQISVIVVVASLLLALIALARGIPPGEVFFLAVALAVSAIPEGLPVALTVALSIAASRMARRNVIVRKLTAVEGLGSCTYIASDKTGTLTVNKQTVRAIVLPDGERFSVTGEGYNGMGEVVTETETTLTDVPDRLEALALAAVYCNEGHLEPEQDGWAAQGDAVDIALLALGYKLGLDPNRLRQEAEVVAEIPFESERRFAATAYQADGSVQLAVKGALEAILPRCRLMQTVRGVIPIDATVIEPEALGLAANGYRVIALAHGPLDGAVAESGLDENNLPPLTLLGLVGLIDPLRPEARDAVLQCGQAGINVAMVTGDHPATALAIARELGIAEIEADIVTGNQLATIGDPETPEFLALVRGGRVFARVAPLQKLQIVEALTRLGHFVAVTGDGVNDAPAMRAANIGVAMGSGTDVAKDTAAIIVTDDNFASIKAGVEEGRFAYANVRKVTYLLISTGLAEVILVTLAIVAGLPLPLFAAQLLWLNLVTNGIQDVALAFEGGEPGAMRRPPRSPQEGIFNPLMIRQTVVSGLTIGLIGFGVWHWLIGAGYAEDAARNLLLLLLVLFENVHVFNCRSEERSAFRVPIRRNRILVVGVAAALGIHLLAMQIPLMQEALGVAPVALQEFAVLLLVALSVLVVMEVFKLVQSRLIPRTYATG
jgi:magnesium-transporting ATPase (P-type)